VSGSRARATAGPAVAGLDATHPRSRKTRPPLTTRSTPNDLTCGPSVPLPTRYRPTSPDIEAPFPLTEIQRLVRLSNCAGHILYSPIGRATASLLRQASAGVRRRIARHLPIAESGAREGRAESGLCLCKPIFGWRRGQRPKRRTDAPAAVRSPCQRFRIAWEGAAAHAGCWPSLLAQGESEARRCHRVQVAGLSLTHARVWWPLGIRA
jgi:hypothetical protein